MRHLYHRTLCLSCLFALLTLAACSEGVPPSGSAGSNNGATANNGASNNGTTTPGSNNGATGGLPTNNGTTGGTGGANNGTTGGTNNGTTGGTNNGTTGSTNNGTTGGGTNNGTTTPPEVEVSHDVVVFGAGTGGVAAAIQARRMGSTVALVEETDWVGGQATAGGVSTMDEGPFNIDSGLYAEFWTRVEAHYGRLGKRTRQCGIRAVACMEPAVGQQIYRELLQETGVTLYERTTPVEATLEQGGQRPTLRAVRAWDSGLERFVVFSGQVFIDATEYGDLLPLTGARYRLGNGTSDNPRPDSCVQDITWATIITRYDGGVPPELQVNSPPPGYGPEVEAKFSAIVQSGGIDWGQQGWGAGYPVNWTTHVSYRATPDSSRPGDSTIGDYSTITRTGVNWANDFPYTARDMEDRRFEANCQAKLHTLQFLYYAQNVLGERQWSVTNDQGFDTPYNREENNCPDIPEQFDAIEAHFTPIPYVRESRRMIGLYTLRGPDIQRPGSRQPSLKRFEHSLAVGDYAMDLHNCNAPGDYEADLESASDLPPGFVSGPFQIPFEVFISADVDGLVAAEKNLSQSRLVSGATRLQPSTTHTGQAAGVIAALAVSYQIPPRQVRPLEAQLTLIGARARLGMHKFSDVPMNNPLWPDVELVSARGIMLGGGDGLFRPNDPLSRAQMAIVLARLMGLNTSAPPAQPTFQDVPTTHFAYAEIEAIAQAGITSGCNASPRQFCPNDDTSRAQMATFLARAMNFVAADAPAQPYYEDVTSGTHFPAIQWLTQQGILNGCSSNPPLYCPSDPTLRRHAAILAARTLSWLHLR